MGYPDFHPKQMGQRISGRIVRNRYFLLLVFLLLTFVIAPVLDVSLLGGYLLDLMFLAVLLGGLKAIGAGKLFRVALALIGVYLASNLVHIAVPSRYLLMVNNSAGALVVLMTISRIIRDIHRVKKVDADTLMGGLCIYLLMGTFWYVLFVTIELAVPGSFNFTVHGRPEHSSGIYGLLFYFSFTSLLTLGLGDIVPMSSLTQSLVVIEGLLGQFYMAIFIAGMVGMYMASVLQERK